MIKKIGKRPPRIVIHGVASVGKTTLASQMPSPVFIACEDGSRELDVPTWVFDDVNRVTPKTLDEFRTAVRAITKSPDGCKTLVIDGATALDNLVITQVCTENRWKNPQQPGFGKAEAAIFSVWREVVAELEQANETMMLAILGHSRVENFNSPDSASFGRYQLAVTSHKLGDVAGFLFGWSDVFGFARFEQLLTKTGERTITVGVQGARVLYLQRTDAFDAKCRSKFAPAQIPMSWPELAKVISAEAVSPVDLRASIAALMPLLPDDKHHATAAWLAGDLSVDDLTLGLERVKGNVMLGGTQ
jgi:hypothetical protein